MEPLSLAGLFANTVGLISAYRAERRAMSDDEYSEFQLWLANNHHNELLGLLERNTAATAGIRALLNQDRETLFEKLDAIDQLLAHVASRVDGFGEIAEALRPGAEISAQALSVLRQVFDNASSGFIFSENLSGKRLIPLDGQNSKIEITEPQFIEDDLATLDEYGLLRLDYNSQGDAVYRVTRSAARFVGVSGN